MPTYDYICDACGHEFEAFESIKADPQSLCPSCSETKLRRKIGAGAAIIFKGSGFYQTDYRSDAYKEKAKADKPPESSTAKSGDGASGKSSDGAAAKSSDTSSSAKSEAPKPSGSGATT
jgi:putative FmdB family regulatory protein